MRLSICLLALLLTASPVMSVIITVPDDYPTIQEAVDNCSSGDEIHVMPGIYGPVYAEELVDVMIIGSGFVPPLVTVIDVDDSSRGIEIHRSTKIMVKGFEIRNCWQECLHFLDCNEVYVLDNYLHDCNDNLGNGLAITRCDNVLIKRNIIVENFEVGLYIDALWDPDSTSTDVQVINNTIGFTGIGSVGADGLTQSWSDTGFVYVNNINVWNSDYGLHYKFGIQTTLSELQYNCHYGNLFGPWGSCVGDSTNIYVDPLFAGGPGVFLYFLSEFSPCIDAGDPEIFDPDSTRSDIGALYYNQGNPGALDIELIPDTSNIVIPPAGGHFGYTVAITNLAPFNNWFDAWLMLRLPSGLVMGPLLLRTDLLLLTGQSIERRFTMDISPMAMSGEYRLTGYVGNYSPIMVIDSSYFDFEKAESEYYSGNLSAQCTISGWGDTQYFTVPAASPQKFDLILTASPNPFNPQTTIAFDLPEAGEISLKVFDSLGREVEALGIGHWALGKHSVVWNARDKASGIYFVSLQYNNRSSIEKILLIK